MVCVTAMPDSLTTRLSATDLATDAMSRRCSERWLQAVFLATAVAVPVLGSLMVTLDGRQVAFAGLETAPLPSLCASRWLGFDCPSCGLTRSVIALMAGDLRQSVAHHRFGWLILLQIVAQIPYRAIRLARPQQRFPHLEIAGFLTVLLTGGVIVVNWFVEAVFAL